jgi:hypothetical protein
MPVMECWQVHSGRPSLLSFQSLQWAFTTASGVLADQRRDWRDGPNNAAALDGGLGELGITACQFQFLSLIAATPKLNQTDLVEASGIDRWTTAESLKGGLDHQSAGRA